MSADQDCCNHNCRQGRDCPHKSRDWSYAICVVAGTGWATICFLIKGCAS